MFQIIYSEQASDDLAEIAAYYAGQGGVPLADNIIQRITADIQKLAYNPKITQASLLVAGFYDRIIYKLPYRALFTIDEAVNEILIVRVVHTSRIFPLSQSF